jgi:hypothetical protein
VLVRGLLDSCCLQWEFLPEIVRDDNDTTGEVVDGVSQGIDGGDIETVGRLVEQQHVGAVDGEEGEDDSALLSLGKGAHKGSLCLTAQAVLAELLAPVLVVLRDLGVAVADELESVLGQVKLLSGVLRVHAELQVSVTRDVTAGGAELASEDVEQSRLAHTVGTDKSGTRVHVDTEVEVLVQVVDGFFGV